MLATLLESRYHRTSSLRAQLFSVTLHAGLILGAIAATQTVVDAVSAPEAPPTLVYLPPTDPVTTQPPLRSPVAMPQLPTVPAFPVLTHVPTELPPIDLSPTLSNITDVIGTPAAPPGTTGGGTRVGTDALTENEVDTPARLIVGTGRPSYPEALRSAGLGGEVIVEFVIDVNGRADMRTLRIISSSHDRLTEAVRRALESARFVPAGVGGNRVRQIVRMPFVFSIGK